MTGPQFNSLGISEIDSEKLAEIYMVLRTNNILFYATKREFEGRNRYRYWINTCEFRTPQRFPVFLDSPLDHVMQNTVIIDDKTKERVDFPLLCSILVRIKGSRKGSAFQVNVHHGWIEVTDIRQISLHKSEHNRARIRCYLDPRDIL